MGIHHSLVILFPEWSGDTTFPRGIHYSLGIRNSRGYRITLTPDQVPGAYSGVKRAGGGLTPGGHFLRDKPAIRDHLA